MQGFSGGKFCRVTNRVSVGRQESAPGARAPQPVVAGNQAAGGWVHAGGADSALGPARQGRGAGGTFRVPDPPCLGNLYTGKKESLISARAGVLHKS